jgi:Flagellar protein YcgR/PilZ domain
MALPGAPQQVDFGAIRLPPGTVLRLQAMAGSNARYAVRYVGMIQGRSVLVTVPPVAGGRNLWLPPGLAFTARFFAATTAYAFGTRVVRARASPYAYVHLTWPNSVQSRRVRKGSRIQVDLPCILTPEAGDGLPGRLLDLSLQGAMVEAARPLGAAGRRLTLAFSLEGEPERLDLLVPAMIRSEIDAARRRYGLGFDPLPGHLEPALRYHIEHRILEGILPQAGIA